MALPPRDGATDTPPRTYMYVIVSSICCTSRNLFAYDSYYTYVLASSIHIYELVPRVSIIIIILIYEQLCIVCILAMYSK